MQAFRRIDIQFLGVWDTVMALGSRFQADDKRTSSPSHSFHVDARPAQCVLHARQALAIDEVRYDFRPEVWTDRHSHQSLEQRWFPGVHSNVGGSYPRDGLANVTFHWMLAEARKHGLAVDAAFAKQYRPYVYDQMYRSDHWYYRLLDAVRRALGRGKRSLIHPSSANITVDVSVILRMKWSPEGGPKAKSMRDVYRPRNVMAWLATQSDLQACLRSMGIPENQLVLPADVVQTIEEHHTKASHTAKGQGVPQ